MGQVDQGITFKEGMEREPDRENLQLFRITKGNEKEFEKSLEQQWKENRGSSTIRLTTSRLIDLPMSRMVKNEYSC